MNRSNEKSISFDHISNRIGNSRGKLFGILIIGALLAFELFNYSTTEFALNDLLGGLSFMNIRWATILAIAFCGIDFAGIARLFTPQQASGDTKEVWYLFGAWLLAAAMNAMLTWWGVALAIVNHESLGGTVIARDTLITVVPIFVAVMVWLIRVLIIGTFSVAGDRLYSLANTSHQTKPASIMSSGDATSRAPQSQSGAFHPVPKSTPQADRRPVNRPDPTYHPAGMSSYKVGSNQNH
jgi:hypothetical protein